MRSAIWAMKRTPAAASRPDGKARSVSVQPRPAESHDPRIDAALAEYLERIDQGQPPDTEEFISQHSEIADELRSLIAAEVDLRQLAAREAADRADSTKSFALHGQETIAPQAQMQREGAGGTSGLKEQFGRYRIVRVLGQGAMGTVYLAEDTQLQRQVALKTPHFDKDPSGELLERLYREARAAATLRHPHICPVHDVGQIDGTHYISMAYIEGHPLSAFIRANKPQPERQILIVIRKLAQALSEAHEHKIVHRDLKPANIMVDKRGEPLIMDFGLARQVRPDEEVRLTHSGMLVGTPAYMSPEQVGGEPDKIGPLTDEYSLGVILYELLTGQLPFRGSMMAVLGQIVTKDPTPLSQLRPGLDPRIEAVCSKMMAKEPSDRFPSLAAVAEELASILKNPGARPAPTGASTAAFTPLAPAEGAALANAGASQILKSQKQKPLTESDLASLEELARKCLTRYDYDQVIQIAERVPAEKRSTALEAMSEKARARADEISFLICDVDEAVRLEDGRTALKKAEALLKIKPGHHRALEVQQQFGGEGDGEGSVRIGPKSVAVAWREGGWIPWSALAFGLAVFGVTAGVIIWWVGRTAIVIDARDPNIKVEVQGKDAIITVPGKQSIKVEAGSHQLTVSYGGMETKTTSFTLKTGEVKTLTVGIADARLVARLENEILQSTSSGDKQELARGGQDASNPTQAATPAAPSAASPGGSARDGYVPLFNGKDLSGWSADPNQQGAWHVEDGNLVGGGAAGASFLYSDRTDYKNFRLRIEARLKGNEYSGLWVRTQIPPPNAVSKTPTTGYKVELREPADKRIPRTGSIWAVGSRADGGANYNGFTRNEPMVEPGQWFTLEVIAEGKRVSVLVNGQLASETNWLKKDQYESGRIALQQHVGQPSIEFRKIEIKELPADVAAIPATAGQDGFVPLFNGKDLSGWARDPLRRGEWQVKDGILSGGGPSAPSTLYSDRAGYRDFHLRAEARIRGDASSGLCFRTELPSPESQFRMPTSGFEVELTEPQDRNAARTGSVYGLGSGGPDGQTHTGFKYLEPIVEEGKWFTVDVFAEGLHTVVMINGRTTLDNHWVKQNFRVGRIALQQQLGKPSVEFRKIEIKELSNTPDSSSADRKQPARPANPDAVVVPFNESQAKAAQKVWSERLKVPAEATNSIGMKLELIPPGQFSMGVLNGVGFVTPVHDVSITRPFYLGAYEVTRRQFASFVARSQFKTRAERGKGGWRLDDNSGRRSIWDAKHQYTWRSPGFPQENNHPVVDVCWDDAQEFCHWLSRTEGKTYRLPTEAEWEYAARAGTPGGQYNGQGDVTQIANVADASTKNKFPAWKGIASSDGFVFTSPAGQFRPNSFGLYDMLGNVMEWCSDWYDADYYKISPTTDPQGPPAGKFRSARGGTFTDVGNANGRWRFTPDHHGPDCGFRVVCEIPTIRSLVEPAPGAAAPAADDNHHAWVGADSRFDKIAAGKWRETFPKQPGHAIYFFDEVARTPEYLELIDKTRIKSKGGVSVRLEHNQALMRWGGPDKEFKLLQAGQWVTTAEPSPAAGPVVTPSVAPGSAGMRRAWLGKTKFENIAAGKWQETFPNDPPGHEPRFFDEVTRTPRYVELIDRIRSKDGVRIRLEDNQALILWPGRNKDFTRLKRGHWIATTEPPVTADSPPNGKRKPFFDGSDLAGWHGLPGFWHVKDDAIVGSVPPGGPTAQTFLCSEREYNDFELKFQARLLGGVGNSGVQFRSKIRDPKILSMVGPQCEICANDKTSKYPSGSLLTEPHGEPAVAPAARDADRIFKPADFNAFEIRCVGKHVRIKLNGKTMVDADCPSMPDEGLIGWQMHGRNPPQEVTFKDIEFTNLSAAPVPVGASR
jgi:serine/threonine protein kinase/formylglycine-generating enzyme required for sulfatase activity